MKKPATTPLHMLLEAFMAVGGVDLSKKRSARCRVAGALSVLTVPLWLESLGWRLAYSPWAAVSWLGILLLAVELFLMLFALAAAGVVFIGPPLLLFRSYRTHVAVAMGPAAVLLASFAGGMWLGQAVWRHCVRGVAERGEPLVVAVHEFNRQNGRPPQTLDELVPDYIEAIPGTGIGSCPKFRYYVGERAMSYRGNPWVLELTPPCHPMGFDVMLYFPRQNYPAEGYGGVVERIGAWAYVHE